ncbi:MAG: TetR/AcrR family transcriptional regulator [Chitinophagales bacterium]
MNKTNRQNSRQKIINAALCLFAKYGYEKTTIRMIAQKANVSLGLMYNYFDGKDELLRAIFINGMYDIKHSFIQQNEQGIANNLTLDDYLTQTFALLQKKREFWTFFYSIRSQPAVINLLLEELLQWRTFINKNLTFILKNSELDSSFEEVSLLFASIDGICSHYVLNPEHYPIKKVRQALLKKY